MPVSKLSKPGHGRSKRASGPSIAAAIGNEARNYEPPEQARRPGRPANKGIPKRTLMVQYKLLMQCWRALEAATEQPGKPATIAKIADAARALYDRTGGHIAAGTAPTDDAWGGKRGPAPKQYALTLPNGKKVTGGITEMAEEMRLTRSGVRQGLQRGGGIYVYRMPIWSEEGGHQYLEFKCEEIEDGPPLA